MKKRLCISFLVLAFFASFGSLQKVDNSHKKKETTTLPPDVGSNKYSKKRN
jgi:hypothetical protein